MARYYTLLTLITLLLLGAVTASFNYYVDPYRAFHRKDLVSPSNIIFYFRLIKSHQLRLEPGELLLLGSSRIAQMKPNLPASDKPDGYNAALPGATSYEMLLTLRHAYTHGHNGKIIVGLDYPAFFNIHPRQRFDFAAERWSEPAESSWRLPYVKQRLWDNYQLLLSAQSSIESLQLVTDMRSPQTIFYSDGSWETHPSAIKVIRPNKFLRIGKQYFKQAKDASQNHDLQYLREMVRFSYDYDIDIVFFVSPAHAMILYAYQQAGQLEHYLQWQRDVLQLLEEEAARAGKKRFSLYGFQTYAPASTEPVESAPQTPLFTDGVHYSFEYGDIIREHLLGVHQDAGVPLDLTNLKTYWQLALQQLATFEDANPALFVKFKQQLNTP